jgi:RNA polymerase sigma factor (sigma-70 family)
MRSPPLAPEELRQAVLRARDAGDLATRTAAFETLVVALQDFVVGCAYATLRDAGLAEDAAQESFVIAWRRLDQLKEIERFPGWLRRIVASRCHRILRKTARELPRAEELATEAGGDVEERMSRDQQGKLVREALAHLPAGERTAVVLFYYAGHGQAAIAAFLGISEAAVAKRLFSARRRLRTALAPLQASIQRSRPSRSRAFAAMVRAGVYADYVGLYRFPERPELTVRVMRVGNRLVSFSAGQRHTIVPGARLSELRAREFDGRARFVRSRSGRVTHFVYYEFGKRMGMARKVE